MKKVALYVRVSSQEQAQNFSIDAQKDKLINYCKAKSWNIYDIYTDAGWSGANLDRPGIQKLIKDLKDIDVVLVYKLDRLSRSQKDTLYLIEEEFLKNDVDFVSLSESFDTTTPFGKAMIGILSVFAQLERETIKERTRLGKEKRAKEGLYRGGGNVPHGYKYIEETEELIIDEYEANHVREIFRLYTEKNYGYQRIATALNEMGYKKVNGVDWQINAVKRILLNPVYKGHIEYKGESYPGLHKPLVSDETFETVQKIMNKRGGKRSLKTRYLLTSLLKCGHCGARMRGTWTSQYKGSSRIYYYQCYSPAGRPTYMVKDPNCPSRHIPISIIDDYVVDEIKRRSFEKEKFKEHFYKNLEKDDSQVNIAALESRVDELDTQISKLMDLYQYGNIPAQELSKRIETLYNDKKKLENTVKETKENCKDDSEIQLKEMLYYLDNFDILWEKANFDERREILLILVKEVIVKERDNINVILNDILD